MGKILWDKLPLSLNIKTLLQYPTVVEFQLGMCAWWGNLKTKTYHIFEAENKYK